MAPLPAPNFWRTSTWGAAGAGALSFFDLGGGRALFLANDAAHGHEPWVTDERQAGTHLLADINSGPEGSFAGVGGFVALNDHDVLFAASQGTSRDLWVTRRHFSRERISR